jgi:glycosyltransferase involved in cell wall biosynthesis
MLISVVIRTLNESKCLGELLTAIESQVPQLYDWEVVVVDSGSDDGTIAIARDFGCRIARKLARMHMRAYSCPQHHYEPVKHKL